MENIERNLNSNIEHIKKMCFWRSAFFGLVILIAGIAIGGASMSIFASQKMTQKPQRTEYNNLTPRLVQNLGLQQQQIKKIRPILDEHMQKLYEIREEARVDIADTLEQMNKEIYPLLSDLQKRRWSNEFLRIQRDINPEPGRNPQGGRAGRRGAGQPAQGGGGGGRLGRPNQIQNQRGTVAPRRGAGFQQYLVSPNSINDNLNTNDVNE